MLPETYDPSFLIDLVYSILQRDRLCGSLSESVRKSSRMVKKEAGTKVLASQLFLIVEQDEVVEWALLH